MELYQYIEQLQSLSGKSVVDFVLGFVFKKDAGIIRELPFIIRKAVIVVKDHIAVNFLTCHLL